MLSEIGPILRSMRHHKGAFSLLVLEVALGFVMLTHTVISARYYYRLHVHPTGMPEAELVIARRRFLHPRDLPLARAALRADLAALARAGVPAAAVDVAPLPDPAAFPAVLTRPGAAREGMAWAVNATAGFVDALGLELVAGQSFPAAPAPGAGAPTSVLLTETAATAVFGSSAAAVGQPLDGTSFGHGRVAGVVRDFSYRGGWLPAANAMVIVASQPVSEHEIVYVARAAGGPRADVLAKVQAALAGAPDPDAAIAVQPLVRRATRFGKLSEGAVIILTWTGFLVVAVALSGSLALASFSVAERTRQIGVRRALGARRREIVRYFLLENLVLTGLGLGLGLGLAVALNQVLLKIMADLVLTADTVVLAMAVFIATGLLSALVPARRAAAIPPWAATRTL